MGYLRKLFGLKKKEEIVEEPKEERTPWKECYACKEIIYEGDRYAKQQGKYFHKSCYKQLLKGF
jgi:hypothetical protein